MEHGQTEAILTLCWSLVADLKLEHQRSTMADMEGKEQLSKCILTKLEIAKDCLRTLHGQPCFSGVALSAPSDSNNCNVE